MTSAAKIAANRCNAQRSTGPRSAAGKARTRYNALHYRFSVPARYDPKTDAEGKGLAVPLSADTLEPCEQDLAMRAAVERVGPPRPREHLREMPFVEDVVRLEIHRAVIRTMSLA